MIGIGKGSGKEVRIGIGIQEKNDQAHHCIYIYIVCTLIIDI